MYRGCIAFVGLAVAWRCDTDPPVDCLHGTCPKHQCVCNEGYARTRLHECDTCDEGYDGYPDCKPSGPPAPSPRPPTPAPTPTPMPSPAPTLVSMPSFFGPNMLLQHDAPVVIGFAPPGVELTLEEQTDGLALNYSSVADASGLATFKLKARPASLTASVLIVNPGGFRAHNVLFGDVILCSGQSNMEFKVKKTDNATAEMQAANWPYLRLFQAATGLKGKTPQRDFECPDGRYQHNGLPCERDTNRWMVAEGADSVANFSAVCYFTGARLMQTWRDQGAVRPLALVHTSVGGSAIQSWSPPEADQCDCVEAAAGWGKGPEMFCGRYAGLFNNLVNPLMLGTKYRAVLWYQGEANGPPHQVTNRSMENDLNYGCMLKQLVERWRYHLGQSALPFYIVQLGAAHYGNYFPPIRAVQANLLPSAPAGDRWPSQLHGEPNTGVVITFDLGQEGGGVHYPNKTEVGRRISLQLRRDLYQDDVVCNGPTLDSVALSDNRVTIKFTEDTSKGLMWGVTRNCTECCEDGQLVLEVSGDDFATPSNVSVILNQNIGTMEAEVPLGTTGIRYGWQDFPQCLLFNAAGLPAGPFKFTFDGDKFI